MYFNLYLDYRSIFLSDASSNVYRAIGVERVRVANLCVTRSKMMHLTLTCEMRGYRIIQRILDSLRMTNVAWFPWAADERLCAHGPTGCSGSMATRALSGGHGEDVLGSFSR
jgi:hypothetical protein